MNCSKNYSWIVQIIIHELFKELFMNCSKNYSWTVQRIIRDVFNNSWIIHYSWPLFNELVNLGKYFGFVYVRKGSWKCLIFANNCEIVVRDGQYVCGLFPSIRQFNRHKSRSIIVNHHRFKFYNLEIDGLSKNGKDKLAFYFGFVFGELHNS